MTATERDLLRLYAVTPDGARRLEWPSGATDANAVFDHLPRGIYEAQRTFDHVCFVGLEEHLERARRSIAAAGLPGELDTLALRRAIHGAVSDYPGADCRLRYDVLAGPATALGHEGRVLLALAPFVPPPLEAYERGVRVQLAKDLSREEPEVKRAEFVVTRRKHSFGTPDNFEPIMVDREGRLLEGVMSNFFAVRAGVLRTAAAGVLPGVTRAFVIRLAQEAGIEAVEEAATVDELSALEEAFFTTSVRSVVPIVSIAGESLGTGRPGPVTQRLQADYAAFCERVKRPAWPPP